MPRLTLWRLLLSNLARRRFRTAALGFLVAALCGGMAVLCLLLRGMGQGITVGTARFGADLIVLPAGGTADLGGAMIVGQAGTATLPAAMLDQVRRLPEVAAASPQVHVDTLTDARCCPGEFHLVGFDPATDFTLGPWLRERTGFGPFDAVVGDRVSLRLGQDVIFFGTPFRIGGHLEPTGVTIDTTVFIPLEGLREMIRHSPTRAEKPVRIGTDELSIILVKVAPETPPPAAAEAIANALDGVEVVLAPQAIAAGRQTFAGVLRLALIAGGFVWLLLVPALGLVFALSVAERRREVGLWRALGATRRFVFRVIVAEAALVAGGGAAVGLAAAVLLVGLGGVTAAEALGIPYLGPDAVYLARLTAGLWAAGIGTGSVAAWLPAASAARLDPYAAIRQGEA